MILVRQLSSTSHNLVLNILVHQNELIENLIPKLFSIPQNVGFLKFSTSILKNVVYTFVYYPRNVLSQNRVLQNLVPL